MVRTSLFQNLRMRKPWPSSQESRILSFLLWTACCPPSSSSMILFSRQMKSTIYVPTGCCRLNFRLFILFARRCFHRRCSASVDLFLRSLARWRLILVIPLSLTLPRKGGGDKLTESRGGICGSVIPLTLFLPRRGGGDLVNVVREGIDDQSKLCTICLTKRTSSR